jgi:hypothetical protein
MTFIRWPVAPMELIKKIAENPNEDRWEHTTKGGNTIFAIHKYGTDEHGWYDAVEFFSEDPD